MMPIQVAARSAWLCEGVILDTLETQRMCGSGRERLWVGREYRNRMSQVERGTRRDIETWARAEGPLPDVGETLGVMLFFLHWLGV